MPGVDEEGAVSDSDAGDEAEEEKRAGGRRAMRKTRVLWWSETGRY